MLGKAALASQPLGGQVLALAGVFSIACGSFALTGEGAAFVLDQPVSYATFNETGELITVPGAWKLANASFALAGEAVTVSQLQHVSYAEFNETGELITVPGAWKLANGSVSLDGFGADFRFGWSIADGAFAFTGNSFTFGLGAFVGYGWFGLTAYPAVFYTSEGTEIILVPAIVNMLSVTFEVTLAALLPGCTCVTILPDGTGSTVVSYPRLATVPPATDALAIRPY